jgi:hypothetical protein
MLTAVANDRVGAMRVLQPIDYHLLIAFRHCYPPPNTKGSPARSRSQSLRPADMLLARCPRQSSQKQGSDCQREYGNMTLTGTPRPSGATWRATMRHGSSRRGASPPIAAGAAATTPDHWPRMSQPPPDPRPPRRARRGTGATGRPHPPGAPPRRGVAASPRAASRPALSRLGSGGPPAQHRRPLRPATRRVRRLS